MDAQHLVAPVADEILAAASKVESERRLPDALMGRLLDAGLFSIYTPRQFDGLELPLPAALKVVEEVSRFDGSTGWTVALGVGNGVFSPGFREDVAARIFRNGSALIAGAPGFGVRAEPVDGGYRLTGQWAFNSGAPNATWVSVAAPVFDGGAPRIGPAGPEMIMALMPPDEVEIIDTWHVTGLCGTGSQDLRVEGLFVPGEHAGGFAMPGGPVALRETPLSRIPFMTVIAVAQSPSVCLGIAQHALEAFRDLALHKVVAFGPGLSEQVQAHEGLARAEALVRSARSYWYETVDGLWATVDRGDRPSVEELASIRIAALTAAENSVAAVDILFRLAGSSGIFQSSVLGRCWRDVHAAAQHQQVQAQRWETAGRVFLGLEPNSLIV